MVFGDNGSLIVAQEWSQAPGKVQVWDVEEDILVDSFGTRDELNVPSGIDYGPDGNLYVSSWWDRTIVRYDASTYVYIDTFVSDMPSYPSRIAFGPDENLYVSTPDGILRYRGSNGAFIDVFIPDGSGGVNDPRGIIWVPVIGSEID
jgi:WD40 repeat protein